MLFYLISPIIILNFSSHAFAFASVEARFCEEGKLMLKVRKLKAQGSWTNYRREKLIIIKMVKENYNIYIYILVSILL